MKAEDTVIKERDVDLALHITGVETEPDRDYISPVYLLRLSKESGIIQLQAEISFKAGIKEVVDWVEMSKTHIQGFPVINSQAWQSKLKEWGIEQQ